jgi:hypothetical protein
MNNLSRATCCGLVVLAVMACAATVEHLFGRVAFCTNGTIHFWVDSTTSPELSQQIADWYSFSHIIHGFALYGIFHLLGKRRGWSVQARLIFTTVIEAGWEMLENSPIIINRYRQTAAQGYTGDSILNSMSDISFCLLGFAMARWLPVWVTVVLIIAMELGVGWKIHDNLLLNIIMLIHPFARIKQWQLAAV